MAIVQSTENKLMNNYGDRAIALDRGEGVYLFDTSGRGYLDFTAGIAVCNLGHAHPRVTQAIHTQARQLIHCSNLFEIPSQKQLAQRLTALSGLDKAFFCNSGTEANEAAIKLARKAAFVRGETDRTVIVSLPHGFHGRTLGALSITPKPAYQAGYHPLVPDCFTPDSMDGVLNAIDEHTAACFVEIVQGEGGVQPLPNDFLQAVAAKCKAAGALLIVDEVQTGVGRTGTFFAFEQAGIQPDVVTMAKGLANGIPIGAVLATEAVAAAFTPGSHGSTFGGNPLATAVANVVVEEVSQPAFLEHVKRVGAALSETIGHFGTDVSGRGLMWGVTVPDAKAFVKAAADNGVLVTSAGEQRVRFVPPLIVDVHHVEEMAARLAGLRVG